VSETLKEKATSGISWTAISQIGNQVLRVIIFILLARILSPEEFGLIGMVLAFTSYGVILLNFGFGTALIKEEGIDQEQWSTVFWFNLILGLFFVVLIWLVAPLISSFYNNPVLQGITYAIAITYLFYSLNILQNTKLTKEFNFKTLALVELISLIASGIVAIILAINGFGVWSLVIQQLSRSILETLILWIFEKWRPSFVFNWQKLKSLVGFSSNVFAMGTINHVTNNFDSLLIGKFEGEKMLGFYSRGYQLALTPVSNIGVIFAKVMFPTYSSIKDDKDRIERIYLLTNQAVAIAAFPLMIGLLFFADYLTYIVFGEKWMPMAFFFKLFSIIGLVASINSLVASMLWSVDKAKLCTYLELFRTIFKILGVSIGILWGAKGAAIGLTIGLVINFFPSLYFSGRPLEIGLQKQLVNIFMPLACSLLLFAGIHFIFHNLLSIDLYKVSWLSLSIMCCVVSYLGLMRIMRLEAFEQMKNTINSKLPIAKKILGS